MQCTCIFHLSPAPLILWRRRWVPLWHSFGTRQVKVIRKATTTTTTTMIQWWWLCCLLVCGSSSSRTTTAFSPTTPHHPEHCFPRYARISMPFLHASPTDLPLSLYQDTVDALETSLQDVADSLSRTQDLTARLVQLSALLAVDDNYDVVDSASSEEEEDLEAGTTAVTDDALLLRAVQRALAASQLLGRDAPETELAWIRVRLSNNSKQHPLLAHPSYRDNYGAYLVRQQASSSSRACAPSLEAQLPPLQQAVADLQDRLRREQAELQRRHARRARGIAQARQSFFLKQDSSASSSSST